MILVISTAGDEHARTVFRELERLGAAERLLDLSQFPQELRLSLAYDAAGGRDFRLRSPAGDALALGDVRVVWWRRPQPFQVDAQIRRPSHRGFAYNESHEAFAGLWQALDVFWVNHPTCDEVAARKVYQLRVAQEVGLDIPATLMSNDSEAARAFVAAREPGQTIYKAFSATEQEWRETRLLKPEEVAGLDNVAFAPVIFQEYVPAAADLRITAVGGEFFPAAIYSQETSYPVDFRMDMSRARIEATALPVDVEDQLRNLMGRLRLVYGAIDMRLTPEGRYVFLEVNPAGQWLFIEQRTSQPISATLAALLASRDK
jgi:glutathione synthase/RimK-type ligase-like ATP-grasp enzyme